MPVIDLDAVGIDLAFQFKGKTFKAKMPSMKEWREWLALQRRFSELDRAYTELTASASLSPEQEQRLLQVAEEMYNIQIEMLLSRLDGATKEDLQQMNDLQRLQIIRAINAEYEKAMGESKVGEPKQP